MAYMNKERKNERAPVIRKILKKYGQKGTLSVRNHSTLVLKIRDIAEMFQFDDDYEKDIGKSINHYWIEEHYADQPKVAKMLVELREAMLGNDYFDESDAMTDYFYCSHYIDIDIFPALKK